MKKMNKDLFAKFIFNIGLSRKQYNFDVIHDINTLNKAMRESIDKAKEPGNSYPTEEKVRDKFHLLVEPLGTHLWNVKEEHSTLQAIRNIFPIEKEYVLEFCWNHTYFVNEPYCIVTEL